MRRMSADPNTKMRRAVAFARRATLREWLLFGVPAIAIVAAAFWITFRFVQPAPPGSLTMSTGAADGAYHRFALKYREILARDGVTLELKPSAGSVENLARLKDDDAGVDVAFVQSGLGMLTLTPLAQAPEETRLFSLANLFQEPVWVFYRGTPTLTRLTDLAELRVAVGQPGSGTRKVALDILAAHGIDEKSGKLSDLGGGAALDALLAGKIDAVFLIAAPEAPVVRRALEAPDLKLVNLDNSLALSRRFPYLKQVTLAQGVFDLKANLPARDIQLVATQANLVVREDLHPALAYLLLEAAVEIHGTPGLFHQPGEFPTQQATDWPLAEEARRYFKTGRPFLQRYLPFWLANFVERMLVLLVPIIAVVVPLFKWLPSLFAWRQHSKINRWYGELKFLERDAATRDIVGDELAKTLDRLDRIELDAARLAIPLAFVDRVYTLRQHIDYVRARLLSPGAGVSNGTAPA
jgi:TRAP transporter TAXI family solute receptor